MGKGPTHGKEAGGAGQALLRAPGPSRVGEHGPCFVDVSPGTGGSRQIEGNIFPQD